MTTLLLLFVLGQGRPAADSRVFGCHAPFTSELTEERLVEIFGARNVQAGEFEFAEGLNEPGAVVFPDAPEDKIQVFWRDGAARSNPRVVRVRGERTRWRTADGITIETDLKTVERFNGKPFRLLGFGWDYSGTVMSWASGRLASNDAGTCRVRMRLTPPSWSREVRQVIGEREFSSGHPAMQALNPRVYELLLSFDGGARRQD